MDESRINQEFENILNWCMELKQLECLHQQAYESVLVAEARLTDAITYGNDVISSKTAEEKAQAMNAKRDVLFKAKEYKQLIESKVTQRYWLFLFVKRQNRDSYLLLVHSIFKFNPDQYLKTLLKQSKREALQIEYKADVIIANRRLVEFINKYKTADETKKMIKKCNEVYEEIEKMRNESEFKNND